MLIRRKPVRQGIAKAMSRECQEAALEQFLSAFDQPSSASEFWQEYLRLGDNDSTEGYVQTHSNIPEHAGHGFKQ